LVAGGVFVAGTLVRVVVALGGMGVTVGDSAPHGRWLSTNRPLQLS
jgi:hypothetical protein